MVWSGPTTGLIHRWPLDLADLSGGVDSDVVGSINITESGSVISALGPNGAPGGARYFDGLTGFGTFASSPLPASGPYTVSHWLMTPDITFGFSTTVATTSVNLGTNSGSQLRMAINNGTTGGPNVGSFAWMTQGTTVGQETNAVVFTDFVFSHAAVTFDGGTAYQTIINGAAVSTFLSALNPPIAFDEIGAKGGGVGFFYGSIAQLAIYNRVLTPGELNLLYQADAPVLMPLQQQRMAFV